ncbi:GlxA family transcriptional regulator [Pararhodobacter sp. SW119]|uniref:GlxA family transcriptional regulator n=1 Tax=Pararhodobacter sp. SW119 TaxID=2780075 RepID=UPI001AE02160|nr:GlxA family transcriptional regulator [Pararhodobacter sp. SW119]
MTKHATVFAPSDQPLEIALLVLPRASILEVASVLDPMRSANRHLGRAGFRWRVVSPGGAPVPLTCGIELPSSGPLSAANGADVLIVIAGYGQAEGANPRLVADLRRMAGRFFAIGGVDAGPWVVARAGLLDGHRATVHWEDLEDFALAHPQVEVVPDRFVISRNRFTAGGAAPAADLMLHLIGRRCGAALAGQVAGSFLYDAAVDGARPQRPGMLPAARDARLSGAMRVMSAHIEAPLPLAAVARQQGLSLRRLEQLFRAGLGQGPGAAYLDLRLQAARRMLVDTRHPVQEIALRCGFAEQSSFSRAFRRRFGMAPRALRASEVG